jgi:glutathione S-transferase
MILYGTYYSPFARRVGAALVSRDIAFEHIPINGFEAPAEASRLNPVGRIPVLELPSGERLIDSWAILDFLDGQQPAGSKLLPAEGAARIAELKTVAITTAVCEIVGLLNTIGSATVGNMLRRRERLSEQLLGGARALDDWAGGQSSQQSLTIGTISAVVTLEYLKLVRPDTGWDSVAPALGRIADKLKIERPFSSTNPLDTANA